jgi:predicted DNA-binding protein (MmcQ/YjbR family)
MDKMFALIDLEGSNSIALKCDPEYALELREKYDGIEGASHFNKKYWNRVYLNMDVDDKLIKHLLTIREEVLKKFTRKMRAEYEAMD